MRVLVTGHRGYIGAVLSRVLRQAHFEVVGLDCDLHMGCDFGRVRDDLPGFEIDLRDLDFVDLLSFDAVIHLAALPEDPECVLDEGPTWAVNRDAAVHLAECCKQAGVGRFLFASTCAVYGSAGGAAIDEDGPLAPLTAYAQAKLEAERAILGLADRSFTPVILRNATVYGVSPRLRLDTVVNDFVGSAVTRGRVDSRTNGRAWRPLIHVEDLARAYAAILTLPAEAVHSEVFNVAITEENYRVIDVADLVAELVPDCTRSLRADVSDRRSYVVDGAKLGRALPNFTWRWALPQGIRQLRAAMMGSGLTAGDWRSDRYRRVLRLAAGRDEGVLDHDFRSATLAAAQPAA